MAAFINALIEEGTRKECLEQLHEVRAEFGMEPMLDVDFVDWNKQQICNEIARIWYRGS